MISGPPCICFNLEIEKLETLPVAMLLILFLLTLTRYYKGFF